MSARPWMKFFPTNWRADPALRMCSLAARGLWMEMLCVMHEATPRGHLLINGNAVSDRQLAALTGCSSDEVQACLSELLAAGVYSVTDNGTVFSRRMVRETERSDEGREHGKRGGNPALNPKQPDTVDDTLKGASNPYMAYGNGSISQSETQTEEVETSTPARETRRALMLEFDETFYPAYPHKVQRAAAARAWPKARSKASLEQIMAGLERYIRDKPPDRHWQNPATFLNGESWNDQPASPPTPNGKPAPSETILRSIARVVEKRAGMGAGQANADDGPHGDGGPPQALAYVADDLGIPDFLRRQ